jgi:hypothetical protein
MHTNIDLCDRVSVFSASSVCVKDYVQQQPSLDFHNPGSYSLAAFYLRATAVMLGLQLGRCRHPLV